MPDHVSHSVQIHTLLKLWPLLIFADHADLWLTLDGPCWSWSGLSDLKPILLTLDWPYLTDLGLTLLSLNWPLYWLCWPLIVLMTLLDLWPLWPTGQFAIMVCFIDRIWDLPDSLVLFVDRFCIMHEFLSIFNYKPYDHNYGHNGYPWKDNKTRPGNLVDATPPIQALG